MEMIIGGAFQGKSTYAKEHHPDVCWKKGADLEKEELMNAEGVLDFQEYIKKELKADKDVQTGRRIMGEKSGYHSGKSGSRIRRCPHGCF